MSVKDQEKALSLVCDAECSRCRLSSTGGLQSICIEGEGAANASIMFVVDFPRRAEDKEGRPLQDKPGVLFDELLSLYGFRRKNVYVTHAVKCRPPANKLPDAAKDLNVLMRPCVDAFLMNEIHIIKPKYIVPMGRHALRALTGQTGIMDKHGREVIKEIHGREVIIVPALHPEYILRYPTERPKIEADFGRLRTLIDNKGKNPEAELRKKFVVVQDKASLEYWTKEALNASRMTVDIETAMYDEAEILRLAALGYDARKVKDEDKQAKKKSPLFWYWNKYVRISMVGFCLDDGRAFTIPWEHPARRGFTEKEARAAIKKIVESDVPTGGQNLKFDRKFFKREGINVANWVFDTRLAQAIINVDVQKKDLDSLGFELCGMPPHKGGKDFNGTTFENLLELAIYCAEDCYKNMKVWVRQDEDIYDGTGPLYDDWNAVVLEELMIPGAHALGDAESRGMYIDMAERDRLIESYEAEIKEIDSELKAALPKRFIKERESKKFNELRKRKNALKVLGKRKPSDFTDAALMKEVKRIVDDELNFNSGPFLAEVLFTSPYGLMMYHEKRTPTGAVAVDDDVLDALEPIDKTGLIKNVRRRRKIGKRISTYLSPVPALIDDDGRLHSTFNLDVARTGRLSSSGPNFQNIPKRGDGREIRRIYAAPTGRRLIEADYSQAELRGIALASALTTGDYSMVDVYKQGKDLHKETWFAYLAMRGEELRDPTKDERDKMKPINFGEIYGQGPDAMAKEIDVDVKTVRDFLRAKNARFPSVRGWINEIHAFARREGYTYTLTGRRRFIPNIKSTNPGERSAAERIAQNTPIQGLATDWTLTAFILIDLELKRRFKELNAFLVNTVHDSILAEAPANKATKVGGIMKRIMEVDVKRVMEDVFGIDMIVPLVADVSIGQNWCDVEEKPKLRRVA